METGAEGQADARAVQDQQSIAGPIEKREREGESGDADALYDAQQKIARIANEEANLNRLKAQREEQAKRYREKKQKFGSGNTTRTANTTIEGNNHSNSDDYYSDISYDQIDLKEDSSSYEELRSEVMKYAAQKAAGRHQDIHCKWHGN